MTNKTQPIFHSFYYSFYSILDDDLNFEYLHNFGPRFKKLADMYGEQPDSSDDDEDGIVNEEIDALPRENLSHRHQYPNHNHQHRAGSHLSDRYDDHPQVIKCYMQAT